MEMYFEVIPYNKNILLWNITAVHIIAANSSKNNLLNNFFIILKVSDYFIEIDY